MQNLSPILQIALSLIKMKTKNRKYFQHDTHKMLKTNITLMNFILIFIEMKYNRAPKKNRDIESYINLNVNRKGTHTHTHTRNT